MPSWNVFLTTCIIWILIFFSGLSSEKGVIFRPQRGSTRGSGTLSSKHILSRGRGSLKTINSAMPTQSISLGFYMPGPQLQGP